MQANGTSISHSDETSMRDTKDFENDVKVGHLDDHLLRSDQATSNQGSRFAESHGAIEMELVGENHPLSSTFGSTMDTLPRAHQEYDEPVEID